MDERQKELLRELDEGLSTCTWLMCWGAALILLAAMVANLPFVPWRIENYEIIFRIGGRNGGVGTGHRVDWVRAICE